MLSDIVAMAAVVAMGGVMGTGGEDLTAGSADEVTVLVLDVLVPVKDVRARLLRRRAKRPVVVLLGGALIFVKGKGMLLLFGLDV